jgi:GNAT superfamily N-acetyltransferase
MRQLTASPEDVARLDALLAEVSFDISREEWLALLSVDVDADVDADRDAVVDVAVDADVDAGTDADINDNLDDDIDADVDVVLANHDAALVYHGAAPTNHDEAEREHEKQLEDAAGAGIAGALSKVRLGATGVFNDVDDLIGLASTVVYSGDFGWCGNIVVRSDYRKRGVASMVLRAALDSMGRSVTALLDASDMGLPLYSKAGFVPVSRVRRYEP